MLNLTLLVGKHSCLSQHLFLFSSVLFKRANMVNSGDGPLVAALRKDPSIGHRAVEMISRPGTFKADEDEAKAFFLIFSQVKTKRPKVM